MTAKFTNTEKTSIEWTDANGVVWSGVRAKQVNGETIIDGDGQIPDQVKDWLKEGNTPLEFVEPPKPFGELAGPVFHPMRRSIGLGDAEINKLIAKMPSATDDEKFMIEVVKEVAFGPGPFRYDNTTTQSLFALAIAYTPGVTQDIIDAAWRKAEKIKW